MRRSSGEVIECLLFLLVLLPSNRDSGKIVLMDSSTTLVDRNPDEFADEPRFL